MEIAVIYEDEFLIVVNKPAGVVSNRAESVEGDTLQDFMEKTGRLSFENGDPELLREFMSRSGLVHRLDKETSGVMVLAKTPEVFALLKSQFKKRITRKMYMALVHGRFQPLSGTVHLPLKRNIFNRRKFCVDVDGKMARTRFEVAESFKIGSEQNDLFTLMRLWPKTGRTHQLRVHMSHLGYPIVSDPLYLGKRLPSDLIWCPRLFLHAKKLSFIHPVSGERVEFESELHEDLKLSLDQISSRSMIVN